MREYGVIYGRFWASETIKQAGEDGRTLSLYLLTSQFGNIIGCYRMPAPLAASELGWKLPRVEKAFASLERIDFLQRFGDLVFIPQFLKWNPIPGPNPEIAAIKEARKLPASVSCLVLDLIEQNRAYAQTDSHRSMISKAICRKAGTNREPIENPSGTHLEG